MPTQECFVCDTCGKHQQMFGSRYDMQSNQIGDLARLPIGWYSKRVTTAVSVLQFQFFCSEGCVSMSNQ